MLTAKQQEDLTGYLIIDGFFLCAAMLFTGLFFWESAQQRECSAKQCPPPAQAELTIREGCMCVVRPR